MDLRRFLQPQKPADARFTLAVVGAGRVVKDPLWAVDLVRRLHERDPRYRLRLIDGHLEHRGPATGRYAHRLSSEVGALPPGVVEVAEHTDDLPTALSEVGVVVSSSVRESFHIGLVEGVASGALPVVRDWPYLPGGAAQIFPHDWIAVSTADAADLVFARTQDASLWQRLTAEAAEHVLSRWDWSVVHEQWEDMLLGPRKLRH